MTGDPQEAHDDLARALTEAEAGLATHQPVVADWSGAVRRRAHRQRTRNIAAAAVVALALAGAAGTALSATGDADSLVADSPTGGPSATATPSAPAVAPAPSASAAPVASVAASPVAEPRTSPRPAVAPEPTAAAVPAGPTEPPASYPPFGTQKIEITAKVSDARPQAGQEVVVEVVATGRAEEEPFLQGPRIDDSGPGWVVSACAPRADNSPPPARDQRVSKTVRHTFDTPGRHTMAFRADSGCAYYRGSDEITLVFDVQPPPPSPAS